MVNSSDLVAVMAELHATLRPGDLAQTLRRVTDAAVELLPDVDGATITVEHEDNRFETAAATGSVNAGREETAGGGADASELTADVATRLDGVQQSLDEGPAVDVVASTGAPAAWTGDAVDSRGPSEESAPDPSGQSGGEPVESPGDDLVGRNMTGLSEPGQAPAVATSDLARDDRYPAYGVVAVNSGVRAQMAIVLFDTVRARGVLNLYSGRAGAFDDTALLTDLFAHHSATALAYAAEYHDRDTDIVERPEVGQALGIVMERFNLSESGAFALLQQAAESRAVSVRLVAQELVASAEEAGSAE